MVAAEDISDRVLGWELLTALPVMVLVALLAGRLLGVRRSLSATVLSGIEGGPPFTGDTSLYEFFGYFGLFCSTVLVLRVLVATLRDGLN